MRKGQTIIEAIVAVSVLVTGFLGILGLLARSFLLSRVTSDQLTATYLASEGIEIAKNLTDHDVNVVLAGGGGGWGSVWGVPVGGSRGFQVDYTTCAGGGVCPPALFNSNTALSYDPTTHFYSYSAPQTTGFTREIRITVPDANEIVVDSIVTWSTGPFTFQNLRVEDTFYNWHP